MNKKAPPPYHVAVNGLPHFCKKLTELVNGDGWKVPYRSPFHPIGMAARFSDLARCDLAYSWMGRISMGKFLRAAKSLGKTKIIMLWCGSDALFAKDDLTRGKMDRWVMERVHWAVSPWLAEEVRSLGVACEYVQTSFVGLAPLVPLPKRFSVLVYAPLLAKAHLYGLDLILEAARKLPAIDFKLVGLKESSIPECPANLQVYGHMDLAKFYREATVLWRPVRHDGLSFMVLEALAHGRHVLYSYSLPGCVQVASVEAACGELERLRDLHESHALGLNEQGRQIIARDYAPPVVRSRLLDRWKEIILSPENEFGRASARSAVSDGS